MHAQRKLDYLERKFSSIYLPLTQINLNAQQMTSVLLALLNYQCRIRRPISDRMILKRDSYAFHTFYSQYRIGILC